VKQWTKRFEARLIGVSSERHIACSLSKRRSDRWPRGGTCESLVQPRQEDATDTTRRRSRTLRSGQRMRRRRGGGGSSTSQTVAALGSFESSVYSEVESCTGFTAAPPEIRFVDPVPCPSNGGHLCCMGSGDRSGEYDGTVVLPTRREPNRIALGTASATNSSTTSFVRTGSPVVRMPSRKPTKQSASHRSYR